MLVIIHTGLAIIFIILGILFYKGKGSSLISGFPTQDKGVDTPRLMRFIGVFAFFYAFCIVLLLISDLTRITQLQTIALVILGVGIVFSIIFGNGKHFRK